MMNNLLLVLLIVFGLPSVLALALMLDRRSKSGGNLFAGQATPRTRIFAVVAALFFVIAAIALTVRTEEISFFLTILPLLVAGYLVAYALGLTKRRAPKDQEQIE